MIKGQKELKRLRDLLESGCHLGDSEVSSVGHALFDLEQSLKEPEFPHNDCPGVFVVIYGNGLPADCKLTVRVSIELEEPIRFGKWTHNLANQTEREIAFHVSSSLSQKALNRLAGN